MSQCCISFSNGSSCCLSEQMQSHKGCICSISLPNDVLSVSSNWLHRQTQSYICCNSLIFLYSESSNVSSDDLPEQTVTLAVFFTRMSFWMCSQSKCPNRSIAALVEFVWSWEKLSNVPSKQISNYRQSHIGCISMISQITCQSTRILALVALVGFFARVILQMRLEMKCLSGCIVALGAFELSYAWVSFQMLFQIWCLNLCINAQTDAKSHWLHLFVLFSSLSRILSFYLF